MEPALLTTQSDLFQTVTTNVSNSEDDEELLPTWLVILNRFQLTVAIIGALMNIFTFVMLFRMRTISMLMSLLLKHQAFLDFLVCFLGAIIIEQPLLWTVGVKGLDIAICYIWHSQAPYWFVFSVAGWNLVLIAIERFLAVCKPFRHIILRKSKMMLYMIIVYVTILIFVIPIGFGVEFEKGQCKNSQNVFGGRADQWQQFNGIFYFMYAYFIPCVLFSILYGHIMMTLRKRQADGNDLGQSNVINRATKQFTKLAIVVTSVFILTVGPDSWYFMLANLQVTEYTVNTPVQKVHGVSHTAKLMCQPCHIPYCSTILQTKC